MSESAARSRPFTLTKTERYLLASLAALVLGCQSPQQPQQGPPPRQPAATLAPTLAATPSPTPTAVIALPEKLESWSVQRTYVLEAKGRSAYRSVTVHSDGLVVREDSSSGSSRDSKATRRSTQSRLSQASVATLQKALQDPELSKQPAGPEHGKWHLVVTLNGKSGTFHSEYRTFPGAAGRLAAAFSAVTPPPKDSDVASPKGADT